MATDIGVKIGIDGEKEFKNAVTSINTNLKTLSAEMGSVTSAFIGNEKSVESLTAQNDVLSKRMDALSSKADLQRQRLEEMTKNGVDPASAQYQKLQTELYKTETDLNKTSAQMQSNTDAMNGLGTETEKATKETSVFGEVLKANLASDAIKSGVKAVAEGIKNVVSAAVSLPINAVKAFGSALADVTTAVANQTVETAAYADEMLTLSAQTGLSTTRLQEYSYMAELTDVPLETLTGSLTKLTMNMDKARDGSDTSAAAFEALGVSVTNSDGTLRNADAVFVDAINALGQMQDGAERDAAAMAIFGKSAKDLNPIINMGSEGLAELALEAHDAGAVLSEDTINALGATDDAFQRYQSTLDATKNMLGAEFAEPAQEILTGFTQVLQGDIDGGIESIMAGIDSATEILDELLPRLQEMLEKMLNALLERLPELLDAGIKLISTLIEGIVQALPELIPKMIELVMLLVNTLLKEENLKLIIEAGIELIVQLAIGLAEAFPELVTAILDAIDVLLETLWEHKDDLLDAGKDLIKGLWQGISDMGSWIKSKISGFMDGIVGSIKDFFGIASPSKLFKNEIGANLALGIGEGFSDTMNTVQRDMMAALPTPSVPDVELGAASYGALGTAAGTVEEITIPVTVSGVELARVMYRHIVGEGQRIGAASIA